MKQKTLFTIWTLICLLTFLVGILLILIESSLPVMPLLILLAVIYLFVAVLLYREKLFVPKKIVRKVSPKREIKLDTIPLEKDLKLSSDEIAFKSKLRELIQDTKKSIAMTNGIERQLNHLKDKKR